MNQKGLVRILIVTLIVTATVAGYLIFQNLAKMNSSPAVPVQKAIKPSSESTNSAESDNWKTYTNTEYGFEFQYPIKWIIKEASPTALKISDSKESLSKDEGDYGWNYRVIKWYGSSQDVEKVTGFIYKDTLKEWGYLSYNPYERTPREEDFRIMDKLFRTASDASVYCLSHEGGANHLIPLSNNVFIVMSSPRCIRSLLYSYPESELYKVLESFKTIQK